MSLKLAIFDTIQKITKFNNLHKWQKTSDHDFGN